MVEVEVMLMDLAVMVVREDREDYFYLLEKNGV